MHTTYCNTSHIVREIERSDKHLRITLNHLRFGDIFNDSIKQRKNVFGRLVPIGAHPTLLCRTVDCWEIELFLSRIKIKHEVKHHLLHLIRAAVRLVNLIDNHHRLQSHLNRLLKHETCLRHWPLKSVNQ